MQFLNNLKVGRIFHDKDASTIELASMVDYIRHNDKVFIYSIECMGSNMKSIVRFIVQIYEKEAELLIKKEKLYTDDRMGKYALSILSALDSVNGKHDRIDREEAESNKGRLPRELYDLEYYMKQVENKNMTVKEVCVRLNIGRTTYYRRCKALESTKEKMGES